MDGEWGSNTTNYDYGFRIYNPSIGKFLSVDPLAQEYAFYTPYQFAGNKPIRYIDIDGLEEGVGVRNRIMETGYLKGNVTEKELMSYYEGNAIGALMGIGAALGEAAVLRYGFAALASTSGKAAVAGAMSEAVFQFGFNTFNGDSPSKAISQIDFFDVAISGAENLIPGGKYVKLGKLLLSEALQNAVDVKGMEKLI